MILGEQHLMPLLNGLYDLETTSIAVSHPSDEIGELLRIRLDESREATVSVSKGRYTYEDAREDVERRYGEAAYKDLPGPQHYVRTLIAGGLFDIANREAVDRFLTRHGHPDLEAGHTPVMAGLDTNLFGLRMPAVLGLDPSWAPRQAGDSGGRPPVTGFVLSSGVKEELDWYYKHHDTRELTDAFGEPFARLDNQPAGTNRSGFLGLYEFRDLMGQRQTDFTDSDTGDEAIVDGFREYATDHRKEVLLFSNDTGFVERATEAGLRAQKVAFPPDVPKRTTVSWETLCSLLYMLAVVFGVITLPKATLFGVWNGKDGKHWESRELALESRSPKLAERLECDQQIVDAYAET
jgi:hypothetical protein